jgi:hypothetical protein
MHQPERKYQLFPKDKLASPLAKSLDPEQAFALAMSQNGEKTEKATSGPGLRIRIKEHNLIRRRKASVPELGPMTTVQEVAMDSRESLADGVQKTGTDQHGSNDTRTASHARALHQCP